MLCIDGGVELPCCILRGTKAFMFKELIDALFGRKAPKVAEFELKDEDIELLRDPMPMVDVAVVIPFIPVAPPMVPVLRSKDG